MPDSDTVSLIRDSAIDFCRRFSVSTTARSFRGRDAGYDPVMRRRMVESGWFGVLVSHEYGGVGAGFAATAALLEELGAGVAASALTGVAVLCARTLMLCPSGKLASHLLETLALGDEIPALAWQEWQGDLVTSWPSVTADRTNGGVVLRGTKRFVANAAEATGFIVYARGAQGTELYWVPRDTAGLKLQLEWRADGSPSGLLTLDAIRVHPENLLAQSGEAEGALLRALDESRVMVAAELLGVMRRALDMTIEYLGSRQQFGKPIGSFQALQHRAVELYIQRELARAALDAAVEALDDEQTDRELAILASRAKCRCSEAALRITREAVQLHGAIGFTDEYDIGLYLKRALVLSAWLGNAASHRRRLGSLLFEGALEAQTDPAAA